MKLLIYTIAIGKEYRRLARAMILSIRNAGCTDHVVVFSDDAMNINGLGPISCVKFSGEAKTLKHRILELYSDFDYYLFCDADVLWFESPRNFFKEGSEITVSAYKMKLSETKKMVYGHRYNFQYMSDEQYEQWKDEEGYCSGHFAASRRSAIRLFELWEKTIPKKQPEGGPPFSDQAVLQVAARLARAEGWRITVVPDHTTWLYGRMPGMTIGTKYVPGVTQLVHAFGSSPLDRIDQLTRSLDEASKIDKDKDFGRLYRILRSAKGWESI